MTIVYVLVTVAGVVALSVTVTITVLKVPFTLGVPLITPVVALMLNPVGRPVAEKWYPVPTVPPEAAIVDPVV